MYRLSIEVTACETETLSDELFELGAESVSELPGKLVVICEDAAAIRRVFGARVSAQTELGEDDWKHCWLEHVSGVQVNAAVYVHPVSLAAPPPQGFEHCLLIDPRDAFGFAHPTTVMCLQVLYEELAANHSRARLSLLDVGTGTGILAILAGRMGVRNVAACDLEAEAVAMTRRNMLLNGCEFEVAQADIAGWNHAPGDVVMANLLHNVIRDNLAALKRLVRPGGLLIASGIIDEHHVELANCFEAAGLVVQQHLRLDGWNAYALRAPA